MSIVKELLQKTLQNSNDPCNAGCENFFDLSFDVKAPCMHPIQVMAACDQTIIAKYAESEIFDKSQSIKNITFNLNKTYEHMKLNAFGCYTLSF